MTCHHWDGRVGYKGQRYAVVGDKEDGTTQCLGWTNNRDIKRWQFLADHLCLTNLRLEEV
jgi:hypothetical protein